MNKIGILGGMGPESTILYYRNIINEYRKKTNDQNYPQLLINSINMTEMLDYVAKEEYEKLIILLSNEIKKLELIGSDFIAIASNTPHCVIEELILKSSVPIIKIG